jgi:hypothetical protein
MAGNERFVAMKIAFVDESGSPAPRSNERYSGVAVLATDSPRAITTYLKRIRQLLAIKSRQRELKAAHSRLTIIKRILKWLGQGRFEIYAVIVDQKETPANMGEELYSWRWNE